MYARTIALLLVVAGATGIAMDFMVKAHIEKVAISHASDKATHMVEILNEQYGGSIDLSALENESGHSVEVLLSNHSDEDILHTTFYDNSGEKISERICHHPKAGFSHAAGSHNQTIDPFDPTEHSGHDHDARTDNMTELRHDHGDNDNVLKSQFHQMLGPDGQSLQYVSVLVALEGSSGKRIGAVKYDVDVTDIVNAYSNGLIVFAAMFVVMGAAIFGIPALGYIGQKKIADRSVSKANYLIDYDALTGLLNRRGFLDQAADAIKTGSLSYCAALDVDRFKSLNDTYGHATGDAYLCHVSDRIRHHFGDIALLSRQGGDEFVIAIQNDPSIDVLQVMERLRKDCAQEVALNGITVRSSLSIGVVQVTSQKNLDDVMSDADVALYFAKAEGKNNVAKFNDDMGQRLHRRRALEMRLREAVEHEEFVLHYQPLIDAKTHELLGYEALLRLEDTDGTPISPCEFIPLAEEIGVIDDMGTWVLFEATRRISELSDSLWISINLSPVQFETGNLCETVKSALEQSGLPASRLELEITESLLLDSSSAMTFQIDTLKEMGVSIAMDDFGTGFSSLSYLWKFGFDRLKIDRSFVQAFDQAPDKSGGVIETIVMLGQKLDMEITAEGVETLKQAETLTSLGCNVLQGFYFGRPEPLTDLPQNELQYAQFKS